MSERADDGPRPSVLLGEVARAVGGQVLGDAATRVLDLTQDSRRVAPGFVYAARRGERSDGRAFIEAARNKGAVALLVDDVEAARAAGLPAIVVDDVRRALARAAAVVHGDPFARLTTVGLTGTNGKTTTANLTASVLTAQGARTAVLGTLGWSFEGAQLPGSHTTPEADDLARTAAELLARGASHLVMEVSSHALAIGRAEAVRFAAAGFTNLTHDHLDFHGTMEAYGEAKARLFTDLAPRASVINVDDPFGAALLERAAGDRRGVSSTGKPARLRVLGATSTAAGLSAQLEIDGRAHTLRSPLVGAHNLDNLLVASGLAISLGLDPGAVLASLASAPAVPGRLERCSDERDDVLVLVDYAHTPDALARVLAALRPLTSHRLWCVFGCGGDRDPHKRAPMGEVAARGADVALVTSDNPRSEDPQLIADAIVAGVARAGGTAHVELDRALAIAQAIAGAAPGDTVLIAGKGHEPYQIIGPITRPFDDRDEARRALTARRAAAR